MSKANEKKPAVKPVALVGQPSLIQVKILKHVGHYVPGQVVSVDEVTAGHLCHVNDHDDGLGNITRHVRAVLLEQYEDMVDDAANDPNLTMAQAKALNLKSIAGAPADPSLAVQPEAESEIESDVVTVETGLEFETKEISTEKSDETEVVPDIE